VIDIIDWCELALQQLRRVSHFNSKGVALAAFSLYNIIVTGKRQK
jgi:hypothetical protein